jgi:acetyltransferase-like isoleucine patch superfamily enzyme
MTMRSAWKGARTRRWLRLCAQVGQQPHLDARPTIEVYRGQIRIGDRFRLSSRPVPSHLAAGPGAVLDVGSDVSIGCGAAIAAFEHVRIGDGTHIGPFVIIMDTNFHGAPGDQSVQHDCRPVTIGNDCRIGSRVTITRGVSIGDGAEILAGSVVSSQIPPGVCAGGGRARIIGRAGEMASRWESAAAALPDLLMAALGLDAPPDLDERSMPPHIWTDDRVQALLRALDDRLRVTLDTTAVREARTFGDVADAVQRALGERQPPAGRL